ncbi:MAG: ribonuclease R [Lachnospiraceae bacterium]|nr:ribonuclease R [Lachnospiraceae bacterium]
MENNKTEYRKNMLLELFNDKQYVPMKVKELAILLQVPRENREQLQAVLDELVYEGKISVSKKGKYSIARDEKVVGVFETTQRGYGFVRVEGQSEDIFIPESSVNGAFHMDTVEVIITSGKSGDRKCEGKILRVLSHGIETVVGTYQKSKSFGFVVPDNSKMPDDIFVREEDSMGAVTGHKVVVKLTKYSSNGKSPEGKVVEIIGHLNDPGTDILSIVRAYDIPMEFSKELMQSLDAIPDEVLPEEKIGRMDIRDWQTVTIDGEDAKDLDDAITITKNEDSYTLGVHIADVTHYVKERSLLDKEAVKRGTSVYLVDRVIPMLPHKLSNGICSLNESVDRLALSCIMDIDLKGNIIDHRIAETLINVDKRMSYAKVKGVLEDKDEDAIKEYDGFVEMLCNMQELAAILREKRYARGSIDFDFPESKIILNEKGEPIEIKPYDRNVATKIIEDFMIAANETVSEEYFWQEIPFLYRTHDNPDTEKISKLALFINNFGYTLRVTNDEIHPKEIQKLITKIEGSPQEALISRLTLRSMKRAQYTTEATGHFGLSSKYYSHFTSPIRRYPDLQIHRIIKENLNAKLDDKRKTHYSNILPEIAGSSSRTERRAEEAERETDKLKKVEYMSKRIGEVYDGVISGLTAWGIYVELPNTIEGMVRITSLKGDYFHYDDEHYEMVGEMTNRKYLLGQKLKVEVVRADKMLRTIDFEIVEE